MCWDSFTLDGGIGVRHTSVSDERRPSELDRMKEGVRGPGLLAYLAYSCTILYRITVVFSFFGLSLPSPGHVLYSLVNASNDKG